MKRIHVYISGKVQGVFFRASTRDKALKLNILGGVRNLPDGRVEIIAEAEKEALDRFLNWCRIGPPGAIVKSLSVEERRVNSDEFTDFQIFS